MAGLPPQPRQDADSGQAERTAESGTARRVKGREADPDRAGPDAAGSQQPRPKSVQDARGHNQPRQTPQDSGRDAATARPVQRPDEPPGEAWGHWTAPRQRALASVHQGTSGSPKPRHSPALEPGGADRAGIGGLLVTAILIVIC